MASEPTSTAAPRRVDRGLRRALPVIVIGVAGGLALAQNVRRTLHQDLPAPKRESQSPTIGSAGSGNPTGLISGNKILPEPGDPPSKKSSEEPVLGAGGFAADRATSMRPDDNTGTFGCRCCFWVSDCGMSLCTGRWPVLPCIQANSLFARGQG